MLLSMPRPLKYPEIVYIRLPPWTVQRIEAIAARAGEHRTDWLRRVILAAVAKESK